MGYVNYDIELNFKMPTVLKNAMLEAEKLDKEKNYGAYENWADTIDVCAKSCVAEGYLTKKQWDLICMRYPYGFLLDEDE